MLVFFIAPSPPLLATSSHFYMPDGRAFVSMRVGNSSVKIAFQIVVDSGVVVVASWTAAALSPKWIIFFAISIKVIFQPYKTFEPPSSTLGEDVLFWTNSMPNNFYLKVFWLCCVFLAVL